MVKITIDLSAVQKRLQNTLSPRRYQHSLGTAAEAEHLAQHWGVDPQRAYLAGLLHDSAKGQPDEQLLALAKEYHIPIDTWEAAHPDILHGPVAAALLLEQWGVNDPEISEAIALHTVPAFAMSTLAKILYLADKIEPNRKSWPGLDEIRRLAYLDLDQAMEAMLRHSVEFLAQRADDLHPSTKEIWQQYRNKITMPQANGAALLGKSLDNKLGGHSMTDNSAESILQQCVALAQEKKGRDIISLKLRGLTVICDYFLLVSATNTRQAQSICDNIEEKMKENALPPLRIEGYREGRWILLDFGSVVVHIFLEEERQYYDLERLWGDAERVEY